VKVLISTQQRLLPGGREDLIFASIDGGMITVVARGPRRQFELPHARGNGRCAGLRRFLGGPHRSFLVNIHHIKEVIPWFKSTYMLK